MGFLSNIILGLALSVDASCVAAANTFTYNFKKKDLLLTAFIFGLMQGILPLIGFYIGSAFEELIQNFSSIIAFIVLSYFGGKMILEHFKKDEEEKCKIIEQKNEIQYSTLIVQGFVTSIDALLIGISFIGLGYNMLLVSFIIAITTFIVVLIVSNLGNKFKKIFQKNANIFGGIVLIVIGLKILLDNYLFK